MTARRLVPAVLAALLLLTGCGQGSPTDFIRDTYTSTGSDGDGESFSSPDPVGTTTGDIAAAAEPAARQSDGGAEYLRYDDDIVIVTAASSGSTVRVEDVDGRYSSGYYAFLGSGFRPGSPASGGGDGGPGDGK
ncbi:DUF4247 domain-containing protein [Modestobacter sp. Leaf380]|uniref:DUF4247 domain-containing protein n=1 Tax=Modestobacter sp. Leaf380 TaxID=1736356 RepID=UPI0006FE5CBC|nr:DUF4247 domain-containing protein [Modestobacter sp. Leaf380]KQS63589.1 hypothetical protein ASG41_18230 [Modestobacter sp. Leaf380]